MFERLTDGDTELSVSLLPGGRVSLELDWGDGVTEFYATPEQAREIAQGLLDAARVVRQRQRGTKLVYEVIIRPSGKLWELEVSGVGVTQCEELSDARKVALDYISCAEDLPLGSFEVGLVFGWGE